MSNVSNIHDLRAFKAGDKALSDQRLAKVGYKSSKKNPAKYPSVAASVPKIDPVAVEMNVQALMPYIVNMLENAQDGVIRSLYESSDGARTHVSDEEISIPACIGFMEAEMTGARLTGKMIEEWFDRELSENLSVVIGEKLGFNDPSPAQLQEIGKHTKTYRSVMAMLAGGKTFLAEKQIAGCRSALALIAEDDEMSARLNARLDSMEKKEKIEELLDL
jgi:hypothetical protein